MINKSKLEKTFFCKHTFVAVIIIPLAVSVVFGFVSGFAAFKVFVKIDGNKISQGAISENKNQLENKRSDQTVENNAVDYQNQIIKIINNTSASVVSVVVSKDLPKLENYTNAPFQDFFKGTPFEGFFGPFDLNLPQLPQDESGKVEIGGGTGFVVGADGLILTNRHVVSDKNADYTVVTNDGKKYDAKIIFLDPIQDLAFIRVKELKLKPLKFGDSDKIEIGQTAITIGNALGEFSNSVNVGVISGLKRKIDASTGASSETLDQVIQTDAAINRGNSGGPLLNIYGEVIGVNTAMAIGAENIGFAIPINVAKNNVETMIKTGKIVYPYLGVRYVLIDKTIQQENKLSVDYGALIVRGDTQAQLAVMPGSPADKAGLLENDIILEFNGKKIDETYTLAKAVFNQKVGSQIALKVLSKGKTKTIKINLEEIPADFGTE
jgi:serine protease Do